MDYGALHEESRRLSAVGEERAYLRRPTSGPELRTTHASILLKAGVPVKVVSERLGHANPAFTITVYQHIIPGMQADAATVFSDLVAGVTPAAEALNDVAEDE